MTGLLSFFATLATASGNPAVSGFTDAFASSTLSPQWQQIGASTTTVGGGVATVPVSTAYPGLRSTSAWNLTGSAVSVQVTPPSAGAGSKGVEVAVFQETADNHSTPYWLWSGGTPAWVPGYNDAAGTTHSGASVGVPASPLWVRIREASGTIYWDYSSDGNTWTNAQSVTSATIGLNPASVYPAFFAGYYGTESTSNAMFSNFNITTPTPVGVSGSWSLKFSDDFAGSSLNTSKWTAQGSAFNNQNMNPSVANVAVSGGNLVMQVSANGTSSTLGVGSSITSSPNQGSATAGYDAPVGSYVEARIYFPGPGSTPGTAIYNWPAWWTSSEGSTWPSNGEVDIFEGLGYATTNYHYDSSETPSGSSSSLMSGQLAGNWSNSFHIYGAHRLSDHVDIYYDGSLIYTITPTHDLGGAHQILLTMGVPNGSDYNGSGGTYAAGTTGQVLIDYVRAWEPVA